jgi:SAM-dependent methyltransferase
VTAEKRSERIRAVGYRYTARATEAVDECNLCGSSVHVEVASRDRYGFPARLQVCARCGLGFLSPRLTASEYALFYVDVYRRLVSAYHGRLIDPTTVQVEQRAYADELVAFLGERVPFPPRSVLDIGGSTGVVAGAIRDAFGARSTVVDPSPAELAVAAEAGSEAFEGLAEDFEPGDRRWDLVLLCQTIDHLLDVTATVRAIRRALHADGHAFVDILDLAFVLEHSQSVEEAVKIDHPHYLTRATALAFFTRAGLLVAAERLSGDGHRGFLLKPGTAEEPDWASLGRGVESLLAQLTRVRARR